MSESKGSFIKQSIWMIAATLAGGVGMVLVHMVINRLGNAAIYAQFKALLAIFYIVGAPQAGIWNLFAQRTAMAVTPEQTGEVGRAAREFTRAIFLAMGLFAVVLWLYGGGFAKALNLSSSAALWATWGLTMATLFAAIVRGLLQGGQNFKGLGWVSILDGLGRVVAVAVILRVFAGQAAGAVVGALVGNLAAIAVGLWASKAFWRRSEASFSWRPWLGGFLPFMFAGAALQTLSQFDNVFLQASIPKPWETDLGQRYSLGSQVGFGLTQFTVPLALVMFPKIARGAAKSEDSGALKMTLFGTLALGGLAALACTIMPWLPVKILSWKTPTELSAPLVPWFVWGMLAYTLGNVLIGDRLARGDYRCVPWIAIVAVGYAGTLYLLRDRFLAGAPAEAFGRVVRTMFGFNLLMLGVAIVFSRLGSAGATAPAQPEPSPAAGR
jgi:O-antigen/teichoic acid export membrane protein